VGERLDEVSLGPDGVAGDRRFALRNHQSGRVLSAKKVARLLAGRARTQNGSVTLSLPDGSEFAVDDDAVDERLSTWLGFPVAVVRPLDDDRPEMESDVGIYRGRAGTFFDSSPVHFVTSSTLATLKTFHPDGLFDPRRFRPNVVLETPLNGFVEESWLGATMHLGAAEVEITKPCSRCVMTTHAMDDLPVDRDILRTVNARNDEHVGVYGIVRTPGVVRVGDEASIAR
jgi:uncharacterized protein